MAKFKMENLKGAENLKVGDGLLNSASKELMQSIMKIEYIKIGKIVPNSKNKFSMNDIEELAQQIDMSGLEQPLVVRWDDYENCMLLTGHRRLEAIKLLVEQGKWDSDSIPCVVKDLDDIKLPLSDDMKENLAILTTNRMREKTFEDISFEINEWKKIFDELKKQGIDYMPIGFDNNGEEIVQPIKGVKSKELISNVVGISPTQVGRFQKIDKDAAAVVIDAVKENKMSVDTASEIAKLPEKQQEEFIEKMKEEKPEEKIEKKDLTKFKTASSDKHVIDLPGFKKSFKRITDIIKDSGELELDNDAFSKYVRAKSDILKIFLECQEKSRGEN